jgi:hypothetical protein
MNVRRSYHLLMIGLLAALIAMFSGPGTSLGDEHVKISPHKIVLNAEGKADDIQAIVQLFLPSPYITNFEVTLWFDDTVVAEAESAFYCVQHDNLIIGFDRQDLQDNDDVIALAGKKVVATVEGYVDVEGYDSSFTFTGTDKVKIVKPGKK